MLLSEKLTVQLSRGAVLVFLATTLLGGHLLASYIFLDLEGHILEIYGYITLSVVVFNLSYFVMGIVFQLTPLPNRGRLMKAVLCLLINIPIAIGYLVILLSYEI
ncbi:hypothetical protein [uncultured Croceitalea sp.]|uniref:hypothetical protein n=1 Tax=uncultured Croceitalea sp. TaxID=1798908 RepID=UPI003305E845